ncbi:conjugal transfer protein TraX [Pseudomonas tructae]|uniref:Conjugal transfer protein TraX n=1 Tax=Pseudomonas tructae TaxID=2518644 RepID=A0A411MJA3_9PSED|nr:TraX family protein [Pseudomonas tructae]QBF26872.1 conjugal transfer protein TraX [Pseudomonas tructae]
MAAQRTAHREIALDLLKWLAIISMVADHLRFLWPEQVWLFMVGRLAFPWFCLAIAANVARSLPGQVYTRANARYLIGLLVFSLISEPPYRWLNVDSPTLSVMPTLTLGLLVAWGVHHRRPVMGLLALLALVVGAGAAKWLMYGVPGVLLPAAFVLALRLRGVAWLLPGVTAAMANLTDLWLAQHSLHPLALLALGVAFCSAGLGLAMLRLGWRQHIWPIGRWGYAFYPLHLALIKALIELSR